MGVVEITLAISLDGFVTGLDPGPEHPLGTGDHTLRPGGEPRMVDEILAAAGAVVAGSRGV